MARSKSSKVAFALATLLLASCIDGKDPVRVIDPQGADAVLDSAVADLSTTGGPSDAAVSTDVFLAPDALATDDCVFLRPSMRESITDQLATDLRVWIRSDLASRDDAEFFINREPLDLDENDVGQMLVNLSEGSNQFVLVAEVAGDQVCRVLRTIWADLSPPRVQLVEPPALDVNTSEPFQAVRGCVADISAITRITIVTQPAMIEPEDLEISGTCFRATVPLMRGENIVDISATDEFGQQGSLRIVVRYETDAP
jgi:hypothetical protein